jgi:putative type II/III system pilus formation protein
MREMMGSCRQKQRLFCLAYVLALLATGAASPVKAQNAAANDVIVLIDEASLMRLDRPAAEIVVGNPSIADVSVQSGKVLIITGKSFGETNLVVIDADGKMITNRRLIVQEPRTGFVTLYKGSVRQTLHCAPHCTPPLVIGDDKDYFETIGKQIKEKQSISQSSAEGDKQEQ